MKTTKYILCVGAVLAMTSCSGFLEEQPQTEIAQKGVYNSIGTTKAALAGCYSTFTGYDYCGFNYFHVLNTTSGMGVSLKTNDVNLTSMNIMVTDPNISKIYKAMYSSINGANDIIKGLNESELKGAERDRVLGEAYFIRALNYFNIVRLFGKACIYTKPAETYQEVQKPRSDVDDVYTQVIIPDLETAYGLLPEPSDKVDGHPHKMAAKAYLAKVYQTLAGNDKDSEYWQKCYDEALEVFKSDAYSLVRPFANLFGEKAKNNIESIFEVQFSASVNAGRLTEMTFPVGHELMPNIPTKGKSWGKTRPSHNAFNQFDEGDPRREVSFVYGRYTNIYEQAPAKKNIGLYPTKKSEMKAQKLSYSKNDSEYPAWKKYYSSSMTASSTNVNFVFCRYADILLTLAEAANELGKTAEAADYLNAVLDRARDLDGNGSIDPATEIYPLAVTAEELADQDLFRKRIISERLKEFTGECDEWYTLRRRGPEMLLKVMEAHNAEVDAWYGSESLPQYVYKYNVSEDNAVKNLLLPFPSDEINRNENISQNDQNIGY